MVAGLACQVLLFFLVLHALNVAALPKTSRSEHANLPAKNDKVDERPLVISVETRTAAAQDVPTGAQQSQNMYSKNGINGTTAQPGFIPNMSGTRIEVNCSDLSTGRDNKCWDELQLNYWVANWIWKNTCYENEGFSSCFLRKVGYPELDCTGIKLATCTPPPVIPGQDTRVFYVAYSLYGTYYTDRTCLNPLINTWLKRSINSLDHGILQSAVPLRQPASMSMKSYN